MHGRRNKLQSDTAKFFMKTADNNVVAASTAYSGEFMKANRVTEGA
jgi:hypothetical protein